MVNEGKLDWDVDLGERLVGAVVLIGITREETTGSAQEQFFGTVINADADGIVLLLGGSRSGERYRLPPDPSAFVQAEPGSYRLRSTGETLEDPDFITTWTITHKA